MFGPNCANDFNCMEMHRRELLQEAAAARLSRLAQVDRSTFIDRLYIYLGDSLIAAGASLKRQPARQAAPIHLPLIQSGQGLVI